MILLATLSVFIAAYYHNTGQPVWATFWMGMVGLSIYLEAKRIAR